MHTGTRTVCEREEYKTQTKRKSERDRQCVHTFKRQGIYFKKISSQMRNCILRTKVRDGDGLQAGRLEGKMGGSGLGCTIAVIVTVTNKSNRFRVVYGFESGEH